MSMTRIGRYRWELFEHFSGYDNVRGWTESRSGGWAEDIDTARREALKAAWRHHRDVKRAEYGYNDSVDDRYYAKEIEYCYNPAKGVKGEEEWYPIDDVWAFVIHIEKIT